MAFATGLIHWLSTSGVVICVNNRGLILLPAARKYFQFVDENPTLFFIHKIALNIYD